MHLAKLALAAVACGCAFTHEPASTVTALRGADVLPAPSGPLQVVFDEETTLRHVVDALAETTGQHVFMDGQTEALLTTQPIVLGGSTEIPAGEVYAFVEGLLNFHNVFIAPIKGGERPVLGLYSGRNVSRAPRVYLTSDELDLYEHHAALLIRTELRLPNTDVRQLSTSLRAMLTDTSSQLLLPVGSDSLLLGGTAADIARLARTLKVIDGGNAREDKERAKEKKLTPGAGR